MKILKGIGCNPIIALIVHIAIRFLNEAMSFSLFNAAHILSIQIRENLAVVFIVLIVLIVTLCLSEAMPFSLINVVQILGIPICENPAVVFIVLVVLIVTPIPALFCYQKFINYAGRTHLIFINN